MKNSIILLLLLIFTSNLYSQEYKKMMNDNNINFYDVVKEAEKYFKTHDKSKKGSGWKPYQRWLYENESKYYPSGIRNNVDPNIAIKEFIKIKKTTNERLAPSNLNNPWIELGPFKMDTIANTSSAGIGRVEDFYIDPDDTDYMFLSSRSGGLFKTTDGGVNWTPKTDFLFSCGVSTFDVSPNNRNELLINVNNSGYHQYSNGIYKSTDGGNTWNTTAFNPLNITMGLGETMIVQQIMYHPLDDNIVFVGTNNGLYRSVDKLDSWTLLISDIDVIDIAFHPTNENIVYFYEKTNEKNRIHISTDKGLTFTTSNEITGNNNKTNVKLSTSPACPDCIYFSSKNGVWKSVNTGVDFTFQSNPTAGNGGFCVSDTDNTIMIRGYVRIERSTDDGVTFSEITASTLGNSNATDTSSTYTSFMTSTNFVHADLHPTQSINGVFYIGTDGWFCKSENNGDDWTILNQNTGTGTPIRENYRLGVSQSNNYRTITGAQDNSMALKREEHWVGFVSGDGMEGLFHPLNYNWAIGSAQYGTRYRTETGGYTITNPFLPGADPASWVAPIVYDPNNQMIIYDFRTSVWKSEDFGNTWVKKAADLFSGFIKNATIAENNSNIIIVSNDAEIKKSTDGGATFFDIQNNLPNSSIKEIKFDPKDDDRIFVVYYSYGTNGDKVFMTEDGGSTWQNITYNLGNMPIRTIAIDQTDASNIYVGAEIGIYTKPLNGTTWSLYNTNLPNVAITEMEIVRGSNTIRASTWGRGAWENSIIGRENYPSIILTKITDLPTKTTPAETIPQYVTSTIDYAGTLTDVHVAWSIDNPVFDNTISMTNTVDNIWVSDTPIPDYTEGTKIYFKVFATGNNNGTTDTYKFMYTVKERPFCEALGGGPYKITNVKITDSLGNILLDNDTNNKPYTYYETPITNLAAGEQYTVIITSNKNTNAVDYGLWIDFNRDYVFNNTNEQIIFQENAGSYTASATFTVPFTAIANETIRMRARVSKTNLDPCGTTNGEVEDYVLNFNKCDSANQTTWKIISGTPSWDNGIPDLNKPAIIDANYDSSSDGNIICCSLTINANAETTINSNEYLKIQNDLINNGTVNIMDKGSLVMVDENGIVKGDGQFNIHKTTPTYADYDYTYWSSPTESEMFNGALQNSPPNYIYKFNTANFLDIYSIGNPQTTGVPDTFDDNNDDWQHVAQTDIMQPGIGYIAMGEGSPFPFNSNNTGTQTQSVTFTGKINTGLIEVNVFKDKYHADNLNISGAEITNTNANLIGNPYASAIDLNTFYTENATLLEGTFYYWTHDSSINNTNSGPDAYNYTNNDYATATSDGTDFLGVNTGSAGTTAPRYLASGQGIFANVNDNGILKFTNAMRVTGNNNLLRNSSSNLDLFKLKLTNSNGAYRQQLIAFKDTAIDGYSNGQDGQSLESVNEIKFYSIIHNEERHFAIQTLHTFNDTKIIPLGFMVTTSETHQISLDDLEGVFANQNIYIEDTLLDITHNLSSSPYNFTANPLELIENRFILKFRATALSIDDHSNTTISIIDNSNELIFTSQSNLIKNIAIYNTLGQQLLNKNVNGSVINIPVQIDKGQFLIVKLTLNNGKVISRKIIKK